MDEGFTALSEVKERGSALCRACELSARDPGMAVVVRQILSATSGSQPDLDARSTKPLQWTALHFAVDGKAKSMEAHLPYYPCPTPRSR